MSDNLAKIFMRTGDLKNPPRFFVIGDSHALFFAGAESLEETHAVIPGAHAGYRVFYVGPGLASSLVKPASANRTREKIEMALQEIHASGVKDIIFVFGEIDCRFHIRSRAIKNKGDHPDQWLEAAQLSATNYLNFLVEVKQRGFSPVVFAPIASTPRPVADIPWLTLGTVQERNWLTFRFNVLLARHCAAQHIPFVSLLDVLVDEKLQTKQGFSKDGTHLSQEFWPLWQERAKGAGLTV
ncbi:MAG: hypothetical protein HY053_09395 [Proteobacteria bacterium]|nr:hypothetical protein [Pseudomonadota bacterium]